MDKQKQIEEMAKLYDEATNYARNYLGSLNNAGKWYGNAFYNAGYRKISENEVVLTKEEYEDLKVAKDFDYGYYNGESNMTSYYENIRLPEVRNETVDKFAERLKELCEERSHSYGYNTWVNGVKHKVITGYVEGKIDQNDIDEIAKEIKEGV